MKLTSKEVCGEFYVEYFSGITMDGDEELQKIKKVSAMLMHKKCAGSIQIDFSGARLKSGRTVEDEIEYQAALLIDIGSKQEDDEYGTR